MPTKYVCLDDEDLKVKPIVELIENNNPEINIEVRTPVQFDEEIRLLDKLPFDGLLLDLRLDRAADENGNRVNYRALSLAQELRTRMTEGEIPAYPIVLWSVDDNFRVSYDKDETGHDLFDEKYYKGTINSDKRDISGEMIDLANGYKIINTFRSRTVTNIYSKLINLVEDYDVLDPRIASDIEKDRKFPGHIFARSILRNLVQTPGPLICERLLGARLGIDIEASEDWEKLLVKFAKDAEYTGIFGSAWKRWWMYKISAKWESIYPRAPLQRLEANERVRILANKYRLRKLVAAAPITPDYDTRYWHVCKFFERPISAEDAVLLFTDRREWHDGLYASLKAIMERKHKSDHYELHPFERTRIHTIMDSLRNGKK